MSDHDEINHADDDRLDPITPPLKGGGVNGAGDTAHDGGDDQETASSPAWLIPISNIQDEPPPPEAYLLGGIVVQGAVTVLSGKPGVGKSTLAYYVAAQLARYGSVFGFGSGEQVGVAYLDLESPRWLMRKKAAEACQGVPPDTFQEVHEDLLEQDHSVIADALRRNQIKLLIVDTLNRALPIKDANDATASSNRMMMLSKIARTSGAAVLVLAHPQKNENRTAVYNVAGSLEAVAVADIIVIAKSTKEKNRIITLEVVKNRIAEAEDLALSKCGAGIFELSTVTPTKPLTLQGIAEQLIEDEVCKRGKLTRQEALAVAFDSEISEGTTDRAIAALVADKRIRKNSRGELVLAMPSPPPHTDADAPPDSSDGGSHD